MDKFIAQLGIHGSGKEGTNMVLWFNLTTFDIIGSLAFGQSFGGLESGQCGTWIEDGSADISVQVNSISGLIS